jgi:hypothetical protein
MTLQACTRACLERLQSKSKERRTSNCMQMHEPESPSSNTTCLWKVIKKFWPNITYLQIIRLLNLRSRSIWPHLQHLIILRILHHLHHTNPTTSLPPKSSTIDLQRASHPCITPCTLQIPQPNLKMRPRSSSSHLSS